VVAAGAVSLIALRKDNSQTRKAFKTMAEGVGFVPEIAILQG
jgi:hypothetical protein